MGSAVEKEWWRRMRSGSEVMSHVDAELCRATQEVSPRRSVEECGLSVWLQGLSTGEEEVGYVVLSRGEGLVCWERDELIAAEAIRHARGVFATGPDEASINPAARPRSAARVGSRSRVVARASSVFVDYIPWVAYMGGVERAGRGRGRGGRRTRNSRGLRGVIM